MTVGPMDVKLNSNDVKIAILNLVYRNSLIKFTKLPDIFTGK